MTTAFEKWHGLGNDFVVVIDPDDAAWWHPRAASICDRHTGIGADGLLLVGTDPPSMTVVNADGTEPEMCGNGLRCVAAALGARAGRDFGEATIRTGAGPLLCIYRRESDIGWKVRVAAGTTSFTAADAGVSAPGEDVHLGALGLDGLVASVGNPHWIFFEHPGVQSLPEFGPRLETDPRFENRTNVEFVTPLGEDAWGVDVWERGVGITQACGTGATAVAAALVRTGRARAGRPLTLSLPGGPLMITVSETGECVVEGPAVRVYRGSL